VNDLSDSNSEPLSVLQDRVIRALRFDVEAAKTRGVKGIFLSSLTPSRPGSRDWAIRYGDLLTPINAAIQGLASKEGVVFVDCYTALNANVTANIEDDGLHWTRAGAALVAQTFFDRIKATFEVTSTTAQPGRLFSPARRSSSASGAASGRD